MRVLKRVFAAGVVVFALLLVAGYLGRLHPMGDSFAVFRAQGAVTLALMAAGCLGLGSRRLGAFGLALATGAGLPLLLAYQQAGMSGDWTLYQKNMLFRNDDLAGLEADIRAITPDVLTLQEVSTTNLVLLEKLADVLPHQVYCPFASVGGTAVATRLVPVPGATLCTKGLAAMQVEGAHGPVWLVSIHLHWPWPHEQAQQLEAMLPLISGLQGPRVIAGDFNMVRWSATLAQVRAAGQVIHAGPVRGSFPRFGPLLVLAIDHVLSPKGGSLELRPLLGSDHRGLVGRLQL